MKAKYWLLGAMGLALALGTSGCGDDPETPTGKFTFTVKLASGNTNLAIELGKTEQIEIVASNEPANANYTYTLMSGADQYISVSNTGLVTAVAVTPGKTKARVAIKETTTNIEPRYLSFTVYDSVEPAEGGKNWASDVEARQEILGKLENYAMSNYLTGISLFENAGYVRYSSRITPGASTYITGYGLGVLAEGELDESENKKLNTTDNYPSYYHQGTSSDPENVNGWDAQGSDVSDLFGYIASSFWGTKMNASKNGYDWYPVLARDTIGGEAFNRPVHVDPDNDLNLYRTWKVYVKTGKATEGGIKYRYSGTLVDGNGVSFDNREVELEDYETTLMAMLAQKSNVFRGAELAGDTTYGIKGALAFYNRTKNTMSDDKIAEEWENMKKDGSLGVKIDSDANGSYIQLELLNPIDAFTAMYTLSSSLYTPLPKEFLEAVGDGSFTSGLKNFGTFKGKTESSAILDHTIAIGPYYLEFWNKYQEMVFGRNEDWYEVHAQGRNTGRYKIKGVHMRYFKEASSDPEYIYKQFEDAKIVDATGIPATRMQDKRPTDIATKGDSTFKLNVNSCSQERWNELFGDNGTNNNPSSPKKDNAYLVKPWMSNINFLNGIYWAIDREDFAEAQGVTPSFNYFADAYLSDPEKGISYNSTKEHEEAVAKFHNVRKDSQGTVIDDDYGFNLGTAKTYFRQAVEELTTKGVITKGTRTNPTEISIDIEWMYQSDIKQYGDKIAKYITDAFNDKDSDIGTASSVSDGTVKLKINQDAVTKWDDVYSKYLQIGCYDLAFGAIAGNTYNPLNFLEVLKSDNSSGFTLNWGVDTSKVDEKNPIIYDGKAWSFDALWAAADHGTITEKGRDVNAIKHNYLSNPKTSTGADTSNVYLGATFTINLEFVTVPGVELDIAEIHIYLLGVGSLIIAPKDEEHPNGWEAVSLGDGKYTITFTLDAATAGSYDQQIYENNELSKKVEDDPSLAHPFTFDRYNEYWNIEVYYNMTLLGGSPSQVIDTCSKTESEDAKR